MGWDWQLFSLLVVVGAIVLGFVYFDAKRRHKLRREKRERDWYESALDKSADRDGYDSDGVGQVRVAGQPRIKPSTESRTKPSVESNNMPQTKEAQGANDSASIKAKQSKSVADEMLTSVAARDIHKEPSISINDEDLVTGVEDGFNDIPTLDDPLFEFDPKPLQQKANVGIDSVAKKKEPTISQPEQTSLFVESESEHNEPQVDIEPELIFSLFIVASQDKPFLGAELIHALLEQGMRHGDMGIFHRHSQSSGRGPIQFSLANAYAPGTFDMDKVDQLQTSGLAMFMTLPGPAKPMKAYQLMIETARGITSQLGGMIIDSSKTTFSKQIQEHHIAQIQEFERKQLLNKS